MIGNGGPIAVAESAKRSEREAAGPAMPRPRGVGSIPVSGSNHRPEGPSRPAWRERNDDRQWRPDSRSFEREAASEKISAVVAHRLKGKAHNEGDRGKAMKLRVIIHEAEEGGYWAEVPALPGCVTEGETMDEVKANLNEAIEGWLEASEAQAGPMEKGFELELAV